MSVLVPVSSEYLMIQNILNVVAPQNLRIKLYINDHLPAKVDTEKDYKEANGVGYTDYGLTPTNWTFEESEGRIVATYPQQVWKFTGNLGNVYGYYVVRQKSGQLLWVEKFPDGPYLIANNGDQIKITPMIVF